MGAARASASPLSASSLPSSSSSSTAVPELAVGRGGRYRVDVGAGLLGKGGFGHVLPGTCLVTALPVAVKFEESDRPSGQIEATAMRMLWAHYAARGRRDELPRLRVPMVLWAGPCLDGAAHALVLPRLRCSVGQAHSALRRAPAAARAAFALAVASEVLLALQQVHAAGIVHRDIKPENMLLGPAGSAVRGRIFLVDFGLADAWARGSAAAQNDAARADARAKTRGHHVGTARYVAVHTHRGAPPAPRDDIDSLAYVLLVLLQASRLPLPWIAGGQGSRGRAHFERIARNKESVTPHDLVYGGSEARSGAIPRPALDFVEKLLTHARALPFTGEPAYASLRARALAALARLGYSSPAQVIAAAGAAAGCATVE